MEMTMPNIRFKCPHCSDPIEQPIEMFGQLMDCPSCGQTVEVKKPSKRPPLSPPSPPPSHPRGVPKLKLPKPPQKARKSFKGKEYKVLTHQHKCFAEGFTPETLEQAMNAYAARGWHVISVPTAHFPTASEDDQGELVVVLGRNK
jgi:Domain of unknown function (DUF4177)